MYGNNEVISNNMILPKSLKPITCTCSLTLSSHPEHSLGRGQYSLHLCGRKDINVFGLEIHLEEILKITHMVQDEFLCPLLLVLHVHLQQKVNQFPFPLEIRAKRHEK